VNRQEILLKEYEACQSYLSSLGYQYWISAGVFMAVNTALLGAMLYGVVQYGNSLELCDILIPGVIILILGVGMIMILVFLKQWLKRVHFVIKACYERMREIEAELGMWRNWMIHGVDHMVRCEEDYEFDKTITAEDRARLTGYHPMEWWKKWRTCHEYESPRRFEMVKNIFLTLIVIWTIVVALTLLALLYILIGIWVILAALLILIGIIFLYRRYFHQIVRSKVETI